MVDSIMIRKDWLGSQIFGAIAERTFEVIAHLNTSVSKILMRKEKQFQIKSCINTDELLAFFAEDEKAVDTINMATKPLIKNMENALNTKNKRLFQKAKSELSHFLRDFIQQGDFHPFEVTNEQPLQLIVNNGALYNLKGYIWEIPDVYILDFHEFRKMEENLNLIWQGSFQCTN
jgi:hypothetical protein